MSVQPFKGKTFVAFMDISGFKSMMKEGRAAVALDAFYESGYAVLKEHKGSNFPVDGFFVSDCGILFVRGRNEQDIIPLLEAICRVIEEIHRKCFEKAIQLTTSISWGEFSYHHRIEFPGIEKNPIYGNAYVAAFTDNDAGSPKLYPSECRLVRNDLPQDVVKYCINPAQSIARKMRKTPNHFYFEWMRQ
jgi:hypothetical protein